MTRALWYACHGGQRQAAAYLIAHGGDLNWVSTWDHLTPIDAAERGGHTDMVHWLRSEGARSVSELGEARGH